MSLEMTADNWQHAKMTIGHIADSDFKTDENTNGDLWGVVADSIVGKMIAGENMYIYSTTPDGGKMYSRVDGTGMHSWNANQIWDSDKGSVAVAPDYGIIAGTKGIPTDSLFKLVDGTIVPVGTDEGKLVLKDGMPSDDRINVWIGTDGTAYFKGNIYATDGIFGGELKAATGSFSGKLEAAEIKAATITGTIESDGNGKIVGPEICVPSDANPKFHVDSAGNTKITGRTFDAPEIYGTKIYGAKIYAGGIGEDGKQVQGGQMIGLTDGGIQVWNGYGECFLTISASADSANLVTGYNNMKFNAPYINIAATNTTLFHGLCVDFTGVEEVKGLYYTLA